MESCPEQPTPSRGIKLSPEDELNLMTHVVEHQSEYINGKKGDFWEKIGKLFEEDRGKGYTLLNIFQILIYNRKTIKTASISCRSTSKRTEGSIG